MFSSNIQYKRRRNLINPTKSHHHQPCRPAFHSIATSTGSRSKEPVLLSSPESVSLAIHTPVHLKVIVPQVSLTISASQASRMKLLLSFAFKVLSFDAFIACGAHASVQLVIMSFAVWGIIDHVKCSCLKGLRACLADKTLLVISSRQATIC